MSSSTAMFKESLDTLIGGVFTVDEDEDEEEVQEEEDDEEE